MNDSFSLFSKLAVRSCGKTVYDANTIHKIIFIKNLLDFSDDYARSAAKSQFWYLDTDATTVTGDAATNMEIKARETLTQAGNTVQNHGPTEPIQFL